MNNPDRIPCINPACRRTAPRKAYEGDVEIVCRKCWRRLPDKLRDRHKALERYWRRIERAGKKGRNVDHAARLIARQGSRNWELIRAALIDLDRPMTDMDAALNEMGLTERRPA